MEQRGASRYEQRAWVVGRVLYYHIVGWIHEIKKWNRHLAVLCSIWYYKSHKQDYYSKSDVLL